MSVALCSHRGACVVTRVSDTRMTLVVPRPETPRLVVEQYGISFSRREFAVAIERAEDGTLRVSLPGRS
jgi:hypothetical protein